MISSQIFWHYEGRRKLSWEKAYIQGYIIILYIIRAPAVAGAFLVGFSIREKNTPCNERRNALHLCSEILQCKFHMKNTGYKASDIFKKDSLQLNNDEGVMSINSNPERYSGVYKELAELIGDAATLKVWKRFSGLNITFPQKLYSKEFRKEYIRENMDVVKPAEMAKLLGLSERRVRQIIVEIRNDE